MFDSALTHGLFFQLLISLLLPVHHALHQAPVSQTFLQYLQIYFLWRSQEEFLFMNIVKCNQAHTVFKYNFVVLVNLPFVSVILYLSISLDGCWSNFHLVYKILFLPIRCNMTVYVKPIRA